ncbi:MAG: transketolase [Candidatus Krumholzibacteria bacterium]|jgi:transketolase|nr:transketolase [Candidatus Krumholzibacteria bacterium]MDP6669397.1 transketolase [Candidatus Krumholzibacteria bacterium]MDP6797957.1 transketolase [Candidatus Krumholzibacteria bacterium]MDP7021888.1 transketolase [Candidatus Krumholzibacteria bacterium]
MKDWSVSELKEVARLIRRDVLVMTRVAESGHPGGPLSAADYITALYFRVARLDPAKPDWEGRDRIIISNGHCSALNYSVMARRGYFEPSELLSFRVTGSRLQGHPNRLKLPGLEASTGSLGQGLSQGVGMALGARLDDRDTRIFVNVGDGELQEGSCWEAMMSAAHYRCERLFMLVDDNNAQIDGFVSDVMGVQPLDDKIRAFGWNVLVCDGHDMEAILSSYDKALALENGKPTALIFKTKMMCGVASFEDQPGWHGKPLDEESLTIALRELGFNQSPSEAIAEIGGSR